MTRPLAAPLLMFFLLCCGCASPQKQHAPLTHVYPNHMPGVNALAEETKHVVETDYPRIRIALGESTDCPPFSIAFRKSLWIPYEGSAGGYTHGKEIRFSIGGRTIARYRTRIIELSAERFTKHPERLAETVRHEMTHLFQAYPKNTPSYWGEGIAEYIARELTPGRSNCVCDAGFSSYTDGYRCAAAFLQFIHERHGTNIIPSFHKALLRGTPPEKFFAETTGTPLTNLWSEFTATARYTADARAVEVMRAKVDASKTMDEADAILFDFLRTQPGGEITVSALQHIQTQINQHQLPAPELWQFAFSPAELDQSANYPARRTVHLDAKGNKRRFDYPLTKSSPEENWQLGEVQIRDLRTGRILKRLPQPQASNSPPDQ